MTRNEFKHACQILRNSEYLFRTVLTGTADLRKRVQGDPKGTPRHSIERYGILRDKAAEFLATAAQCRSRGSIAAARYWINQARILKNAFNPLPN